MSRQIVEQEIQISQIYTEKFSTSPIVRKHANQTKGTPFLLITVSKGTHTNPTTT